MKIKKIIIKSLIKDRRNVYIPLSVCTVTFIILYLGAFLLQIHMNSQIERAYFDYGRYVFSINKEIVDRVGYENEHIVDSLSINEELVTDTDEEGNKKTYIFIDADDKILDYKSIHLLSGSYPQNKGEAIVDRQLLYDKGIINEDIIGKEIEFTINKKEYKYVVSGIVNNNTVFEEDRNYYILTNDNKEKNQVLYELDDLKNYNKVGDILYEHYGDEVAINFDLVLYFSLNEEISYIDQLYGIFWIFYIFLISAILILLYLTFNYLLKYNSNTIKVYSMLGVCKRELWSGINLYVGIIVFCAFFLSQVIGNVVFVLIYNLILNINHGIIYYYGNFPFKLYLKSLIILLVAFEVVLLISRRMSFVYSKRYIVKKKNRSKHCLKFKCKNYNFRLAMENIRRRKVYGIFMCSTFSVILIIAIMGDYYCTLLKMQQREITSEKYVIEISDEISYKEEAKRQSEKIYEDVKLLKNNYELKTYDMFQTSTWSQVNIKYIDAKHQEFLMKDLDKAYSITTKQYYDENIIVLGYTDEQLEYLSKINKGLDTKLVDDEILALSCVVAPNGIDEIPFNVKENDVLNVGYINGGYNVEYEDFKVKNVIDNLIMEPDVFDYKICIVVNMNTYRKIAGYEVPSKIYIYDYKVLDNLVNVIDGSEYISIINLEDENAINNQSNKMLYGSIYSVIGLGLTVIGVVIILFNITEMDLKKKELLLYRAFGISNKKIIYRVVYEVLIYWIIALIVAIGISKAVTKYIEINNMDVLNIALIKFPYASVVLMFIGVISIVFIVTRVLFLYIKKCDLVEQLKYK